MTLKGVAAAKNPQRRHLMTLFNFLGGLGIGAGVAYLLDPDLGRRRQSLLRDQLISMRHRAEDAYGKTSRDLTNRIEGTFAELNSLFSGNSAPDYIVKERVRAKLGRFVSHPHAIEVSVENGCVTLRGPILSTEVQRFVNAISTIPGVQKVDNWLDVHEEADISALQGGIPRAGQRVDFMQENWAPATRVLVGSAGAALMFNCLARRNPMSMLLGTAGFLMSVRASTNVEIATLFGTGAAMTRPQMQMQSQQRSPQPRRSEHLEMQEVAGMPEGVHEIPAEPRTPFAGI
jgi:hypothetical protein